MENMGVRIAKIYHNDVIIIKLLPSESEWHVCGTCTAWFEFNNDDQFIEFVIEE